MPLRRIRMPGPRPGMPWWEPVSQREKNVVIMAFTRKDTATGKLYAHTALGGGALGLFGSGSMCSWPNAIRDVHRVFSDTTPVDRSKIHDDSNGRSCIWGLAATTLGAVLHETAHTFGLPHVRDSRGVMSRGFDYLNRVVTVVEPPCRGRPQAHHFRQEDRMRWIASSAEKLAASSWFRPDGDAVVPSGREGLRKAVAQGLQSSWSPDGKRLVFSRHPEGGLHTFDLVRGTSSLLTHQGKDPSWSPDGRFIAYVIKEGPAEEIWRITPAAEENQQYAIGGFPHWSADGKTLFFHSRTKGAVMALKVEAPEATPTSLVPLSESWYPAVSPDGTRIAYGAREKLHVVECATGKALLTWPTPRCGSLLPAWSRDGSRIAFGGFGSENAGLWILSVVTGKARRIVEGGFTMPAWSPDGNMLAADNRGRAGGSVWIINLEKMNAAAGK